MNSELERARREWQGDVEDEMARLIRLGVPPCDAAIEARQRISSKRRAEAASHPSRDETKPT